jgi:hypothetical protein
MSDFEEWDFEVGDDIIVVADLGPAELLDLYGEQKQILLDLGEVLAPTTQAGRDAHSLYGACKIELVQRGML